MEKEMVFGKSLGYYATVELCWLLNSPEEVKPGPAIHEGIRHENRHQALHPLKLQASRFQAGSGTAQGVRR
jgi:hypothetical protein